MAINSSTISLVSFELILSRVSFLSRAFIVFLVLA
jgi:hypothetical protein